MSTVLYARLPNTPKSRAGAREDTRSDPDALWSSSSSFAARDGRIGGVRIGLRGTTDLFFPLQNDPFTSPGGTRCDVATARTTLAAFVRAPMLDGDFSAAV